MSRLRPDARTRTELVYKPVDLIADMIGGLLASLIFRGVWRIIEHGDGEKAPGPTDEQGSWREILLAAGLHGTIFAVVKAAMDRGAAEGTRKLTGAWPGAEGQQPGKAA
jgi:hypothetical protein